MIHLDLVVEAFDALPISAVVIDHDGTIVLVNRAWRTFAALNGCARSAPWEGASYLAECDAATARGIDDAEVVKRGLRMLLDGERETFVHEYECSSPDEQRFFVMRAEWIAIQRERGAVVTHENVTSHKLREAELTRRVTSDPLTGLLNRDGLADRVRSLRTHEHPSPAMLFVDLDGFKAVNDTYGHIVGDGVLEIVAERLRRATRERDLVARVGGDEFVVFVDEGSEAAHELSQRIESVISQPIQCGAHRVRITASVGTAAAQVGDDDIDRLLQRADAAMYDEKWERRYPFGADQSGVTSSG